jgi:putative membrane protein
MFYVLGLGPDGVVNFGFLGVHSTELRWAYTTRLALLLFGVPWLLSLGKPVALAQAALSGRALSLLHRFLESWFMRVIGNAVVEPLLTVAVFLLFITPFSAVLRLNPLAQEITSLLLPILGLLMVLPIAEHTRKHSGFAITFEFMLAFAALPLDALPGILLRLNGTVLDKAAPLIGSFPSWFPSALHDQHLSGDWLWFLGELADIPVIIILFVRWSRHDRGEANQLDALSDEEMDALNQAHLNRRQR